MGFKSGRITCMRYWVNGDSPLPFDDETLEKIGTKAAGHIKPSEAQDGISAGWSAGDHVLDLSFDLAKNVLDDALHIGLRIDTDKIPSSLLKAYTKIETDARAKDNPSGFPTKAQRQEAKEAARQRAETEASDGRFRRLKTFDLLWDGRSNILYAGTTTASALDRLNTLFRETFDRTLEPITAGSLAARQAHLRGQSDAFEASVPTPFLGEGLPSTITWAADPAGRDFLGNEFFIWLWHTLQNDGDTLALSDGSEVTVMQTKTLQLDCPRGETGRDTLTDEGPTRMPEAFRALQAGKLPRKSGLVLVRHGIDYDLTLQAETLAVSGLNLPKAEGVSGREAHLTRVESVRHAYETFDLLYDLFGRQRLDPAWDSELGRIRRWLKAA